jgi:hypothetical protein
MKIVNFIDKKLKNGDFFDFSASFLENFDFPTGKNHIEGGKCLSVPNLDQRIDWK